MNAELLIYSGNVNESINTNLPQKKYILRILFTMLQECFNKKNCVFFRDVDITQLQAFDAKNSPCNRDISESGDCFRARKGTLCGGLAGLQDPDNMTI